MYYSDPLVGVIIDISEMVSTSVSRISVECGIDMDQLGTTDWSSKHLSKIYEIPKSVTIKLKIDR